jgi:hypothetical protein
VKLDLMLSSWKNYGHFSISRRAAQRKLHP